LKNKGKEKIFKGKKQRKLEEKEKQKKIKIASDLASISI
jgi:hypothetical protein